jgi:hypothetical protein
MWSFTTWLASPTASVDERLARHNSQPSDAGQIAVFKVATRNLANSIHVPYDRIMSIVADVTQRGAHSLANSAQDQFGRATPAGGAHQPQRRRR